MPTLWNICAALVGHAFVELCDQVLCYAVQYYVVFLSIIEQKCPVCPGSDFGKDLLCVSKPCTSTNVNRGQKCKEYKLSHTQTPE